MEPRSFSRRDLAYLLDIYIAANKAVQFVKDLSYQEFILSELHQSAVIRPLEIIGEAARMVSNETKAGIPEIPWDLMIGMRNRLIHEYFAINLATVWDTVHNDLPALIAVIEPLIPSEDEA